MVPLDFRYVVQNEATYDNFADCYQAIRSGATTVDDDVKQNYIQITEDPGFQTGIQFIDFFEQAYECSGVCKNALFFY